MGDFIFLDPSLLADFPPTHYYRKTRLMKVRVLGFGLRISTIVVPTQVPILSKSA
jgi:hypothetical protein